MEYEPMDIRTMGLWPMGPCIYESWAYGPTDYGPMDHGPTDYGHMDLWMMDGPMDYELWTSGL